MRALWVTLLLALLVGLLAGAPATADTPTPTPLPSGDPTPEPTPTPPPSATPTPIPLPPNLASPLHVEATRLVDASGGTVFVRGLSRSGTEYACAYGFAIFDGPSDQASIDEMRTWNVNAVRVPLNEDCWLGINGVPDAFGGANYQRAITDYVALLNRNGLYAIVDLHWSAAGTELAMRQQAMPDLDHSPAFWSSVATAFKGNDAVIFELFNEPHPDWNRDSDAAWACWRDGGTCDGVPFPTVGMQTLVDTVRATGATNVLALGGVWYGNGLSQWLTHRPTDPLGRIAAAWHIYNFLPCSAAACYDATAAPVAAQVPLIATEIGTDSCQPAFVDGVLSWLRANASGAVAWAWHPWGTTCDKTSLIGDYSGTPTEYGQPYRDFFATQP